MNKKILVATFNRGKFIEIKEILADIPFELVSLQEMGLKDEYEEIGSSFLEIARNKANYWSKITGLLTLGEDSGLEVPFLSGAPGIFSARYAGIGKNSEENIRKLLKEMNGIPIEKRKAFFKCAVAVSKEGKVIFESVEEVEGIILEEKRGGAGFGYDPVFYYPPLRKTFAELTVEEKNKVSHRGKALRKAKEFLLKFENLI
jgi:XTP/dITP diphosphohydrolase